MLELIRSSWDGWGGLNKENLDSIFCSELVAEAYQRIGILNKRLPSNEYTPQDFSQERIIHLNSPFYLGEEIQFEFSKEKTNL